MAKKKSDLEKRLEALAKEHGATLSAEGDGFMLVSPKERAGLYVDESTDQLAIDRYLRGAGA